jgi:large subunit ribosomal protein L31
MKQGIHPRYELTEIRCSCGNVITTKTTAKSMDIDICSACHPFFTGTQKMVDTAGRIERFKKRYGMEG